MDNKEIELMSITGAKQLLNDGFYMPRAVNTLLQSHEELEQKIEAKEDLIDSLSKRGIELEQKIEELKNQLCISLGNERGYVEAQQASIDRLEKDIENWKILQKKHNRGQEIYHDLQSKIDYAQEILTLAEGESDGT